jgi:hypothetical protein
MNTLSAGSSASHKATTAVFAAVAQLAVAQVGPMKPESV